MEHQRILQPKDHFTTKYGDFMGFQQQNRGFDHEKWPFSATAKAVQMASLPTFKKPWTNVKWTVRPG
jgi:hypothetical protein